MGFEEVAAPITSFSALKQKRNSSQRTSTFLRAPNYTERCATEGLTEEPAPLRHQMDQISSSNRFPTETAQKADGGRICAKPQAMGCSQIAQIYSANSSNEGKRWHVFSHAVTQEGHDMIMLSRKETIWQKRRQKKWNSCISLSAFVKHDTVRCPLNGGNQKTIFHFDQLKIL